VEGILEELDAKVVFCLKMRQTTSGIFLLVCLGIASFSPTVFFGCDADPVTGGDGENVFITGLVVDTSGIPVPEAFLNFAVRLKSLSNGSTFDQGPSNTVGFGVNISERGYVNLSLHDFTGLRVRTLLAETLDAGHHLIFWDLLNDQQEYSYTDCYYLFHWAGDSLVDSSFALIATAQHLQVNPAPYVQTDAKGRFTIPLSRLPVNKVFFATDDLGNMVDSLKLDDTQVLYAFNSASYGTDSVSLSAPLSLTITLSTPK